MGGNTNHFGKQHPVWLDKGGIDGWVNLRQLGLELYRVIHRVVFKAVTTRILGDLIPPHVYHDPYDGSRGPSVYMI